VPIAVNTGLFWPGAGWRIRSGTARIHIGPPLESTALNAEALSQRARDWIEAESSALLME
jgi:1-acyl-sn-glycerol-3-phosphate acyltransferase